LSDISLVKVHIQSASCHPPWARLATAYWILDLSDPTATQSRVGACKWVNRGMSDLDLKPKTRPKVEVERPHLYKVILLNDDFTPRDFVVSVLKAVFRMNESEALGVMLTAHRKGACVVAVYTKEVAETKANQATDLGRSKGYPLTFTTEKEE
jgi:ATP-dependent Clp protease adaptor protein ClpS